jgi:hypothetical protein
VLYYLDPGLMPLLPPVTRIANTDMGHLIVVK